MSPLLFPNEQIGVYLCLGYRKMNAVRERLYHKAKSMGFAILSFIHSSAICMTEDLGEGNVVLGGDVIVPVRSVCLNKKSLEMF